MTTGKGWKVKHKDYIAEREARDPEFREAREELKPQYKFRRAMIGARLAAVLTQEELAERMGTTQSAIARLESGNQMPTLDTLFRLATALGVDFTITPEKSLTANPHEAA
ncbi:MAG: helix-turn-helix transcriptional regulator [Actinobacteria bacterium]|nr:helix-turn-helix transcriptional regulator [Actinomycetota bacterium]